MATKTYRGCEFGRSDTTTTVFRHAWGNQYESIERVWWIEGRIEKPAGRRPFLASAADCRQFIREALNGEHGEALEGGA